jgi:hypothetical protein
MVVDFDIYFMENFKLYISVKNCFMKKIMIPLVLLVVGIASNGQSTKQEPPPPPPKPKNEIVKSEPTTKKVTGSLDDDFYKRNPSVSDFSRKGDTITLKKKDGTIEKYDMSKKEEDKSFTEKYGGYTIPPPPPPPKGVKSKA